jgi:hypothetical protein
MGILVNAKNSDEGRWTLRSALRQSWRGKKAVKPLYRAPFAAQTYFCGAFSPGLACTEAVRDNTAQPSHIAIAMATSNGLLPPICLLILCFLERQPN